MAGAGLPCSLRRPTGLAGAMPQRPTLRLQPLVPTVRLCGHRRLAGRYASGSRAGVAPTAARSRSDVWDPDCYEEERLDDPDEYEYGFGAFDDDDSEDAPSAAAAAQSAAAAAGSTWPVPALAAAASPAAAPAAAEEPPSRQRRRPRGHLSRSTRTLLVAGHSMHRLAMRLQTAVLATLRVTWQLGGEALHALRANARVAKQRAEQGFGTSPAGERFKHWQKKLEAAQKELPEDLWGKVMWVWDRPHVQKIRLTISMANFSFRLPALVALVATQIGLLSTSLSLPMLAPLLLGTGMLMRSIRTNASLVFPRIGLLVVLLWLLWFANSVIQNTVAYLRKQGAIDQRLANNINSGAELTVLVTAGVILLSMLGVNVSALLLPAGVAAAVAAKDLSHNFLAGFFLIMVQPFRLGDRVGVTLPAGSPGSFGAGGAWFEGVCEKVDLRYTSLRQGKRRLMVPNSAFLQTPFMITEDAPAGTSGAPPGQVDQAPPGYMYTTYDGRNVWQSYMNGGPVHQELAREQWTEQAAAAAAAGMPPPPPNGGAPADMHQQYATQQGYASVPQPNGQQHAQHNNGQQPNGEHQQPAQQPQQQHYQQPPGPPPGAYGYPPAPPGSYSGTPPGPPPGAYPTSGGYAPPMGGAAMPPGPSAYYRHPSSHPLPPQAFM